MATGVSVNPGPIGAPTTMYPGPPPHQPYSTSALSSVPPRMPGHHNPPHALRRSMDLDQEPSPIQPPRQSLPSIHEALGNDNPLPYPGPSPSGPPSHPHPPSNLLSRPSTEGPAGPPNPFSVTNNSNPAPYLREPQFHSQQTSTAAADQTRASMVSLSTQASRKQSVQSLSGKSPTSSSKTAPTSISTSQSSATYEYSAATSAVASPNSYGSYPSQSYSWQSQPPAPYDSRSYNGGSWKVNMEAMRNEEKARPGLPYSQPHSESVKRQFDSYDVESSLADVSQWSSTNPLSIFFVIIVIFFFPRFEIAQITWSSRN